MSALLAAIKKRKAGGLMVEGDHQDMGHESGHTMDQDKGDGDLHGFVASLDEGQKSKLQSILDKSKTAQDISKGGPSSEESSKVQKAIPEENHKSALEEADEHGGPGSAVDSDAIGKSMLDSRYLGENAPSHTPRNLGERMQMSVHKKLKDKGKI